MTKTACDSCFENLADGLKKDLPSKTFEAFLRVNSKLRNYDALTKVSTMHVTKPYSFYDAVYLSFIYLVGKSNRRSNPDFTGGGGVPPARPATPTGRKCENERAIDQSIHGMHGR